jgi:hypothetical protein
MQESLLTVTKLDDFVPTDHPLRTIQSPVNEALVRLNSLFRDCFAQQPAVAPLSSQPSGGHKYASEITQPSDAAGHPH